MTRKTFVLDTNVLLHDPESIAKFKGSNVVIPVLVLEELDRMKRFTDELGKHARQVIRFIDTLKEKEGHFHEGVEIDDGITVRIYLESKEGDRGFFPLSLDRPSNKILHVAYQIKEKGERVVFVSKDLVMRVKSEAIGIEAEDYENLKVSFEAMYRGYRKLQVSKREIDTFYKDGYLALENIPDFSANEYCLLTSPELSSAICKYNLQTKRLEPLLKLTRDIWGIQPLNFEQRCALDLLLRDDIKLVSLIGQAGTGKTLLALAAGLKKVFDDDLYTRILVSRPIMPLGKDIGYLPGSKEEKLFHWMQPIHDNLEFLCQSSHGRGNEAETQKWIMESKKIEMEAVTYIRGRTLPKIYMIIDEAQNLTPHEVKTIISRAGQGAKVILTGDPTQIDNPYLDADSNGLTFVVSRFQPYPIYGHMFLERTERSELAALAAEVL
jgi:PhoH-like ATPase